VDVLEILMKREDVDVNKGRGDGLTPFMAACEYNREDAALLLLKHPKVNVNASGTKKTTALWLASMRGMARVVKELLDKPEIELHGSIEGATPFWIACQGGSVETVKVYLDYGRRLQALSPTKQFPFDYNHTSDKGATALFVASSLGKAEVVQFLLQQLDDIDVRKPCKSVLYSLHFSFFSLLSTFLFLSFFLSFSLSLSSLSPLSLCCIYWSLSCFL